MITLPGIKVPQFIELKDVVQALSEYTLKFADVDTVPLEDKVVDVLTEAKELSDKTIAIIAIMINPTTAIVIEGFWVIIISSLVV